MKRTFKYIIGITCSLAAVFSCARFDEQSVPEKGKMEHVVFSAVIEGGEQTKTALGGEMGDEYRQVLWQPGDSVGICSSDWWYSSLNKFVNTETEETAKASLSGEIDYGYGSYYAFYPYSKDLVYYDYSNIRFVQPAVQNYRHNSFSGNAMPMVARAGNSEVFNFYSLCGVLAVNLTGSETVKSISFSGYDADGNPMPVAGDFDVYMGYESYPAISPSRYGDSCSTISSVTLDCGDGVTLDQSNPTAFYIVLPVGTYNTFAITVNTVDGKLMLKKSTNPLNIQRANVTKAGSLVFVEEVAFDLSEHGTANCYVVSEPGIYSFKANVIGNGGYGIIDGKDFHTEDPFITPTSAKIIWEDRPGVVNNVTTDGNRVSFLTSNQEGNALIGVVDGSGNILWSWHIWVTDEPIDQIYTSNDATYTMLDRNLGAISTYGETPEINGFLYQWGRKDPIRTDNYTSVSNRVSIQTSIKNPTNVYYSPYSNHWHDGNNSSLWSKDQKTIYDPCPVGYKVPHRDVWLSFSKTESYSSYRDQINISEYQYALGAYMIYDGTNTTFYPVGTSIRGGQAWGNHGSWGEMWSTQGGFDGCAYHMELNYPSFIDSSLRMDGTESMNYALHVRCMKDESHMDVAKPLVKALEAEYITTEGATLNALVADEGATSVTERGIVWGTFNALSLEKGNVEIAAEGGKGNYSVAISGLKPATKYYYRAYARNSEYISYSEAKYFYTPYEGNVYNLSQEGTANCYIVPPVHAEYAFNASVKGNSKEPVGQIYSAEVLWETTLKYDNIQKGAIISEASVDGNNVRFRLSPEVKPGNALIAVKDADGTILWSWHIWVTDYVPEDGQHTYNSGAVMMNRNLGATSVVPNYMGAETTDFSAFGLHYQWGRKDPFPFMGKVVPLNAIQSLQYREEYNNIEYTIQHPTEIYDDVNWNWDSKLWTSSKTIYDPCPVGWRVPDHAVWTSWDNPSGEYGHRDDAFLVIGDPYSSPETIYPLAGRLDWINTWPDQMFFEGYYWSVSLDNVFTAYDTSFSLWNGIGRDERALVRCMKEQNVENGDNEGYTGSDYDW